MLEEQQAQNNQFLVRTRSVFLWTRLLNVPFWGLFCILPFIIRRDLHATPLQILVVVALKPAVSLLSPYWSMWVHRRQDRLVSNLVWANILRFLPFLLFPWIQSIWVLIASYGTYMLFFRGAIPAWMEVIRNNIQGEARERIFQTGSLIDYLGAAVVPFVFGWVLDHYEQSWRWIFFVTSALGMLTTGLLLCIPVKPSERHEEESAFSLARPWKDSWMLLRERPDFTTFQVGFMLGGGALIMMHPILPVFYMDVLNLSYTSLLTAMTVSKGIGFAAASPLCVKLFQRTNIYRFCSWVTFAAGVFPLLLIGTLWSHAWLYLAYVVYGVMQAGSELSWHMSGPVFAKESDSTIFSSTNVLAVGVRGCIAPVLGSVLYATTNSLSVLLVGSFLCFLATERLRYYETMYKTGDIKASV